MNTITPLARAVLEVLDTSERGTGDTELRARFNDPVWAPPGLLVADEPMDVLVELLDEGLIDARFREQPHDMGVTADPIIYAITEAGCDALWALMQADAGWVPFPCSDGHTPELQPHQRAFLDLAKHSVRLAVRPVHFDSRTALREYLQGVAA